MARIPDDELERLKKEVPLAELCRRRGIALKGQGENLMASCPFHDDREPSFVVTPAKNLWHCFGECNKGGDVIAFIMQYEKVSFRHAVDILKREQGMAPAAATLVTRFGTAHPVLIEPGTDMTDAQLLAHVADYYHRAMLNTSKGMAYLQERGILSPDAVNTFKLGFANRTLGYRVPATTSQGKALKAQLEKIGILRDSGHEHLRGCIVFPIVDGRGEIVEMYGRRVTSPLRDAPKHLYLPGPHAGVWNAGSVAGQDEWLLCEALVDALSLWVMGFRNVTASYGTNGFTQDHWKLLRQHKPRRVLLCYDADEAGNKGANELAQQLEPEGVEAWRVEFKAHSDVNDLVRGIQGVRGKDEDPRAVFTSLLAAARRLLPTERPVVVPVPMLPSSSSPAPIAPPEALPASSAAPTASASQHSELSTGNFVVLHDGKQAELKIGTGDSCRGYRVRGLENNSSFDQLKVNLRVVYGHGNQERFHVDTLDLYNARQRTAFIMAGHQILGLPRATMETDLTQLLVKLEAHQEAQILAKAQVKAPISAGPQMTPEEEAKALALLREPALFQRLLSDFELAGVVGEENNKLLGYLIAVSRKLSKPLSGQITARSAAGKSSLMNAILDFVPAEDKQVVTAMTGQALYYLPEDGLAHKVLAIVEDEGSSQASYPLKILQSENELVLAVTVKDPDGGMPQTQLKRVKGPVAQFTTSTRPETDYELENRYLILSVDEGRQQTQRIHQAQRQEETLRGLLRDIDRQEVLTTHHNAQRLLRPLRVNNPFAEALTFPDHQLRLRRDHKKYLGLIRTTAFLRQYQKPIRSCRHKEQELQYIEVDIEDIKLVHELAVQVLGRSLDELSPPTRSFLNELAQQLEPEGVEAWRVEFKPHTDVNDLVRGLQGIRGKDEDPRAVFTSLLAAARRLLPTERPVVVPVPAMPLPSSSSSSSAPSAPIAPELSSGPRPAAAPGDAPAFTVLHDGKQAELKIGNGDSCRGYRVRGLEHNSSFDQLKVNLRVVYGHGSQERFHVDTLDLYNARQRTAFIMAGHQILGLPRATMETDLTQLLVKLEAHQEAQILAKAQVKAPISAGPQMTPEEEAKALALLREPKLFARLLCDFELAGVVGEETNKLLGYLIAVSRKLSKPLSGQITARSAAGKSSLMNSLLDFVPAEDKQVVTAMTGQALYYLPEDGLQHKVLAIVEDEGSSQASYPLKILQSENELVLAVTVKDPNGGMPQTQLKRVKGPVAQFTTSTRPETDYELENRYLILSVDEGRQQTQRIHQAQRQEETLRGLLRDIDRQDVLTTHHNAQRLLRPLRVNNPFAEALTFPDHQLRLRRDHKKYLGLIRTTAFLRQYQKPIRSCQHKGQELQYIEVDIEDIRQVHELAVHVLGRSLDELSPPTRSFLIAVRAMVAALAKEQQIPAESVRFSRRTIREKTGWSVTQVKEHLLRLLDLEYIVSHRVPGLANRCEYELVWDGQGTDGSVFINGLASLATLASPGTTKSDGQKPGIDG